MAEQNIQVNSVRSVGKITVDESRIRGEGGPARPQLVIPTMVTMSQRPDESALALTELRASLRPGTGADGFPKDTIGQAVTLDMADGFLGWTRPDGASEHPVEFRIPLTTIDIEAVEQRRHQTSDGRARFALWMDPVVEGVRHFNQQFPPGIDNQHKGPWDDPIFGMYSQRFTFWTSSVQPLIVNIEMSQWVETILPGLGYNQLRLVELHLPPALPGHNAASVEFDKARLAFDQRRYSECVAACRGLVSMWNSLLGATGTNQMGDVVGNKLDWPTDDKRRTFITKTWVATLDMVNLSHHPEGQPDPQYFSAQETRLLFLQVAALSEFLSAL